MAQDFNRRISIVTDRELPAWQVLNTVAHISAYFGNKMGEQFDTGIETTDDNDIALRLSNKKLNDIEYLGVGVFGDSQRLKSLTKGFRLWA